MARMAQVSGALSIAMTSNPQSTLAQVRDYTLNLHGGGEISVAATQTFVTSAISTIWLLAELAQDQELLEAIRALVQQVRVDVADAIAIATSVPAMLLRKSNGAGFFEQGKKYARSGWTGRWNYSTYLRLLRFRREP